MKNILKEIKLRVPCEIAEDDIILYINSAIRRFGRHIGKYKTAKMSGGKKELCIDGILPECIKGIFSCGEEITSYTINDGRIIFKKPVGEEVEINHTSCYEAKTRDEAEKENIDFLSQDMGIDKEYTDAVIFSVVSDIFEIAEDITAANNYRSKCDEIVRNAMQGRYIKRGKYPVTKDVLNRQ